MSSIQERLQLKRVPLDSWNIREQLSLASAVVTSGDQNWMSVSRALKTVGDPSRPSDWYSQKSCAAQYGALLENVETPKRKKRSSEGAAETPQESILKRLTQQRIAEIQKHVAELGQQYQTLKTEIAEVRNTSTSEERVRELWTAVEQAKRAREREAARRQAWLREREERRARLERTRAPLPASAPPSSPLLTSLLKSSPVVTTPQHISHPANVVDAISPSAGAPTLSLLLEPRGGAADTRHARIEEIKSQLVQIEQQLKANPSTAPPGVAALAALPVLPDFDDIEIKAEDVYAFRDVDLEIPPVQHLHKLAPPRALERPQFVKKEEGEPPRPSTATLGHLEPPPVEAMQVHTTETEKAADEIINIESIAPELAPAPPPPEIASAPEPEVEVVPPEVNLVFPDVKFPVPEIKVVQQEEQKIKEEIKEPKVEPPEEAPAEDVPPEEDIVVEPSVDATTEESAPPPPEPETVPSTAPDAVPAPSPDAAPAVPAEPPLPATTPDDAAPVDVASEEPARVSPAPPPAPPAEADPPQAEGTGAEGAGAEGAGAEGPGAEAETESTEDKDEDKSLDEIKKEVDLEDSTPLAEMRGAAEAEAHSREPAEAHSREPAEAHSREPAEAHSREPAEAHSREPAEAHSREPEAAQGETDDDTPMELVREEDKDGKTRRDYSRKKKPSERTLSGSESAAETSAPDSPTVSDGERQHRLWKKSVLLVYSRLCTHKYASLFQRPISDGEAPGYSALVRRPMDLGAIRRNVDSGLIRTTAEFQRDILLMLSNALMYNSSEHHVYQMAKDMFQEAETQLGMLLAAQAHAELSAPPRRRRHAEPAGTPPLPKRRHE